MHRVDSMLADFTFVSAAPEMSQYGWVLTADIVPFKVNFWYVYFV